MKYIPAYLKDSVRMITSSNLSIWPIILINIAHISPQALSDIKATLFGSSSGVRFY